VVEIDDGNCALAGDGDFVDRMAMRQIR
jgi:hypothetical protein